MAKINLLDVQTANLIAAGEVVERPANVLKELLENAIDAGASTIETEIRGGGIEWIRVTDNGCGMEKDDLALSVRRHATSKIRNGADLVAIATLGFRGEALAAISSTSRFTILSKRREDDFGHQITVEGIESSEVEECGCADGTTVIVKDLFFNQPARRKFLKRAQTESSAILQYVQRIAVSHPEIAFKHTVDGTVKLQTAGNGKLGDCIWSVYGSEFASSLVEISHQEGGLSVYGRITRPEMARNNHSYQSFYINSRFIKSRTMTFALEDAYKSFVKSEKFPGCVLFLEIDPREVDVNVHPTKLEVRFSDERAVYNLIYQGVRKALQSLSNRLARDEYFSALSRKEQGENVVVPTIHETKLPDEVTPLVKTGAYREAAREMPLFSPLPERKPTPAAKAEPIRGESVTINRADFWEDPKPRPTPTPPPQREADAPQAEKSPAVVPEEAQLTMTGVIEKETLSNPIAGEGVVRGVVFHAYILYETATCLYLIDKHAAHERILYETLKAKHDSGSVQLFIEPLVIRTTATEAAALNEHVEELQAAGFLLESFGEDAFLLRGIPLEFTALDEEKIASLLQEAATELSLGGRAAGAGEKLFDRTLYSIACKAAVKAGIPTTGEDHQWIVEKLKKIDNVTVCPHGRPVLVPFTKKQIENLFLRS